MNESWPDARGTPDPVTGTISPWTLEQAIDIDNKDGHWRPIKTAVPRLWIEVSGRSETQMDCHFLAVAIWKPNEWIGVDGQPLLDRGWVPLFWRPWAGFC